MRTIAALTLITCFGISLAMASGCAKPSQADSDAPPSSNSAGAGDSTKSEGQPSASGDAAAADAKQPTAVALADEDAKPKDDQPSAPADAAPAATGEATAESDEPAEEAPADDEFAKFVKAYSKDFNEKLSEAAQGKEVDFGPLVKRLTDRIAATDNPAEVGGAAQVANVITIFAPAETAKPIYESMLKFAERIEPTKPDMAGAIKRMAQPGLDRINLVGTTPKITGTTADGKQFDLAQYKGKVVLLDFWATWCGPCLAELPNVKKTYEEYHDKGFEVVGISLDEDAETVVQFLEKDKLPWVTLVPTGEKRGFDLPLAKEFQVNGIPATFLVDQEGKLVSISARGERLEQQVKKLLAK